MPRTAEREYQRHDMIMAPLFPCRPQFVGAVETSVRKALAGSLEHVFEAASIAADCDARDFYRALRAIEGRRVRPAVFGRYYEIVLAIETGEDRRAGGLLRELIDLAGSEPSLAILAFDRQSLGVEFERYARILDSQSEAPRRFLPPGQAWINFERHVNAAIALLEEIDADLAAELRTFIVEVIGAGAPHDGARSAFGGASSFMLWGAVILNVDRHQTILDALEGLVHEATHHLLFGLSHEEPLTMNPVEARYSSPLRADPRPMDGVFHATFVCARLNYLYRRLKAVRPAALSSDDIILLEDRINNQKERFLAGFDTVKNRAQLTPTGSRIILSALAYVQSDDWTIE